MFALKYTLVILYLILLYRLKRSRKSFNNWLYDYINRQETKPFVKKCGILWLLLSFEEDRNKESLSTCFSAFSFEIESSERLSKVKNRIESKFS